MQSRSFGFFIIFRNGTSLLGGSKDFPQQLAGLGGPKFIFFRQNLARAYYFTIETSMRKYFSVFEIQDGISALQTDPVHPLWTKCCRNILVNLTLETSMWKNFQFIAKSFTANYEIDHYQNTLFLDPCFQGQGMQWSYYLQYIITATTHRSKMAAAAITENYKIGHYLKNTLARDSVFFNFQWTFLLFFCATAALLPSLSYFFSLF